MPDVSELLTWVFGLSTDTVSRTQEVEYCQVMKKKSEDKGQ